MPFTKTSTGPQLEGFRRSGIFRVPQHLPESRALEVVKPFLGTMFEEMDDRTFLIEYAQLYASRRTTAAGLNDGWYLEVDAPMIGDLVRVTGKDKDFFSVFLGNGFLALRGDEGVRIARLDDYPDCTFKYGRF